VRSGTESRLERETSLPVVAVAGTDPVVAQAGLWAAHSSVGSVAGGGGVDDLAEGMRAVASVTPRNEAPQLAQKC
jgi:hypothetical protein